METAEQSTKSVQINDKEIKQRSLAGFFCKLGTDFTHCLMFQLQKLNK